VNVKDLGLTDAEARVQALRAGVGVVAATPFFHEINPSQSFVRIALARRREYFSEGIDRLVAGLGSVKRGV
jgi:aspartate/methionine/tyrosine aminotransferase